MDLAFLCLLEVFTRELKVKEYKQIERKKIISLIYILCLTSTTKLSCSIAAVWNTGSPHCVRPQRWTDVSTSSAHQLECASNQFWRISVLLNSPWIISNWTYCSAEDTLTDEMYISCAAKVKITSIKATWPEWVCSRDLCGCSQNQNTQSHSDFISFFLFPHSQVLGQKIHLSNVLISVFSVKYWILLLVYASKEN